MMQWYFYIALAAILSQLLFLVQVYRNYRYVTIKSKRKHPWYELQALLIVPCKGLDSEFQENIASFFNQEYENYLLWFVVADESDPAYRELCKLKDQLSPSSKAHDVQVLVAGKIDGETARHSEAEMKHAGVESASRHCSQKIHNLLYCYDRIDDNVDVLAFADSDVCVRCDWLTHMVWPLRLFKSGAATGYRWFIPRRNNIASLALSAMNAKVAQFLGNTHFNQAWGGSMAIHVETFRRIGLDKIWPKVLSDDLSLTYAIKKAGMKLFFVPACLVASYESTTWRKLFEFGRRQFLITRVSRPWTWWFALCGSLYSVLGLWGGAGLAVHAAMIGVGNLSVYVAVPIVFFVCQMGRAVLRQTMIGKLLKHERHKMRAACAADILFFWVWSLLLLFLIISSAFGRTICWRGIRYRLLGPTETTVEASELK